MTPLFSHHFFSTFALPQASFDARVVLADTLLQRYTFIFCSDFTLHSCRLYVFVRAPPRLLETQADLNAFGSFTMS